MKTLQNHVDKSLQLGVCNTEPSLYPFAVSQQHERWEPTTQAHRQCRIPFPQYGAVSHTCFWVLRTAFVPTTPWLSPNCCWGCGKSSMTLDQAMQKCSFPLEKYFHHYPAFPSDLAFYPLIRVQFKSILSQKLGYREVLLRFIMRFWQ